MKYIKVKNKINKGFLYFNKIHFNGTEIEDE